MIQRKWERFSIFLGGATHNRTWTENQNSLNTLFTSEEYRMVMDKAKEEADGFTQNPWQPAIGCSKHSGTSSGS